MDKYIQYGITFEVFEKDKKAFSADFLYDYIIFIESFWSGEVTSTEISSCPA